MTELDHLLQQSRQITERIRVLSDEHQALRIKYQLLTEQHEPIGISSHTVVTDDAPKGAPDVILPLR